MKRYFSVKLKKGLNERWVRIAAQSFTNASHEAEKQHFGWKSIDVQQG